MLYVVICIDLLFDFFFLNRLFLIIFISGFKLFLSLSEVVFIIYNFMTYIPRYCCLSLPKHRFLVSLRIFLFPADLLYIWFKSCFCIFVLLFVFIDDAWNPSVSLRCQSKPQVSGLSSRAVLEKNTPFIFYFVIWKTSFLCLWNESPMQTRRIVVVWCIAVFFCALRDMIDAATQHYRCSSWILHSCNN